MEKDIIKEMRRNSNINSFLVIIFVLMMYAIVLLGSLIIPLFIKADSAVYESVFTLVIYGCMYVIGVPVLILMLKLFKCNDGGFTIRDSFRKPQMPAGWIAKWLLIIIGMTYLVSYAANLFFLLFQNLTGIELHPAEISTEDNWFDKLVNFIAIVILAPVFEELFFRASNYKNSMKYGAWSMAIISGLTFGLWHQNYAQTFYTTFLGIFSCFLYSKTKSIIPSILLHFCLNFIAGLQLMFIDFDALSDGSSDMSFEALESMFAALLFTVIILGLAIAGLILFIVEIANHRESFRLENELPEVSGVKKTLVYLTAPVTILMFIILIGLTVINALML